MSLDDFAPAGEPDEPLDDLDEDLFDFPPVDVPEASARPEESGTDELDAMLDETSPALPASEPVQETAGSIDMQLEEEDLLDAPPAQAPDDAVERPSPEAPTPAVEAPTPPPAAGGIDDEVEQIMREAKEEQRKAEERRQKNKPAPETTEATQPVVEPAPALPVASTEAAAVPVQVPVLATGGSPALWVLTALSACFMAGLLFIAWNFTTAYERRLDARPMDSGVAQVEPPPTRGPETTLEVPERHPERDEDSQSETARRSDEAIPALDTFHDSVLAVADSAIEDGRFHEARRMVYALLAKLDRLPPEEREGVERRAAYLIAFSHEAEADHLRESLQ